MVPEGPPPLGCCPGSSYSGTTLLRGQRPSLSRAGGSSRWPGSACPVWGQHPVHQKHRRGQGRVLVAISRRSSPWDPKWAERRKERLLRLPSGCGLVIIPMAWAAGGQTWSWTDCILSLYEGHRLHAALPDCLCGIGPFFPGLPCTPTFTILYFHHLSLVYAPEQL